MFAAIQYFSLGVYNLQVPGLGTLPIDPWFTLVCIGFVVGLEVARARGMKLGMDVRDIVDGAVFIVLSGFVMGHIVTVLAYHPERLQEQGIWALLKVWEGFSSYGGFLGAILGAIAFYGYLRPRPGLRYGDVIMYGFPFGWIFGRLGCFTVHDHIGRETTFFLGMWFPEHTVRLSNGEWAPAAVRHELGLYEAIFTVGIAAVFWYLGRKDRPPGFFMAVWCVLYGPVRFLFEFLRNTDLFYQDNRYLGLTPAHYASLALFGLGLWMFWRMDFKAFKPWPLDGQPDQAERAEHG